MASGSTALLRRPQNCAPLDFRCSCQTSAEHFEQCAEFLPLRNRDLGAFAVTVLTSAIEGEAEILCSI